MALKLKKKTEQLGSETSKKIYFRTLSEMDYHRKSLRWRGVACHKWLLCKSRLNNDTGCVYDSLIQFFACYHCLMLMPYHPEPVCKKTMYVIARRVMNVHASTEQEHRAVADTVVNRCHLITKFSISMEINKIKWNVLQFFFPSQNFPQSHQLITTLNGSVPTTQTLTTTAAFNNINSSSASSSNYAVSEDEISKKLPKEILLRILSYLDVVSLCRCAQVSNAFDEEKNNEITTFMRTSIWWWLLSSWDL